MVGWWGGRLCVPPLPLGIARVAATRSSTKVSKGAAREIRSCPPLWRLLPRPPPWRSPPPSMVLVLVVVLVVVVVVLVLALVLVLAMVLAMVLAA